MLALVLAAAALGSARLPPIDQCATDRSFVAFRAALERTIARRDAAALLKVVADDIQASLGGDSGKADFIALWGLKRPLSSKVWDELGSALRIGCSLRGGVATAPWMADQLGGDRDAFETRIALPGAVLRKRPSERSPAIARLDWHVLTLSGPWNGGAWVKVTLDDGRGGYVRDALARSPIDYRAWFRKRRGRWQMEGFLAGD
ncbi:MAG: SH3 domain-containing protein [Sphingomicrobium sp.]